jgi:hypothetical protein
MPVSFILLMTGVGISFVVACTALIIHGIWVAPFIERHGKRTTGLLTWVGGVGLILDYLTARRLCQGLGIRPRWMKWFASLLVVSGVLAVLITALVLFEILHK